jgi:hypothetical protein
MCEIVPPARSIDRSDFIHARARPETGSGCQGDDDSGLAGSDLEEKGVRLDLDRFDRDEMIAAKALVPGHSPIGGTPIDALSAASPARTSSRE